MITAFRRYLETWPVRIFFAVMVAAFVVWGVGDVVRNVGRHTWVAKAGGRTIEPAQFQNAFQRAMSQAQQRLQPGQDVTPAMRRGVAEQVLQQMVGDVAMTNELRRLRIVVPDAMLRQAVFAMPAFQGSSGTFDRAKLDAALRANGLSEQEFLSMIGSQIARDQLISAITAGAGVPANLAKRVFDFENEKRSASMVEFPFAAAPAPPSSTEADLRRWYDNHPDAFRVPEFRKIKVIVLTAETIAKGLTFTDAELKQWFEAHKSAFSVPAKRAVQVLVAPDEAKAKALAAQWNGGADWTTMQKAAEAAGGSAVDFPLGTEQSIPEPELAKAVFAAEPSTVVGPVKTTLGFDVLKVTKADPAHAESFEQVKDQVRQRAADEQAASLIYDRVNKIDNILGTGAGLDKLPPDLGLVGIQGTLNAKGDTKDGTPAPIPGPPTLRQAIVSAAFAAQKGEEPSELTEVPLQGGGSGFYALTVEDVIPPTVKPFDQVKDQVSADWTKAQQQSEQEKAAAQVLSAVKGGEPLADAAAKAGLTVRTTPLVSRQQRSEGMPPQLQSVLFGLKKGEPTMVETPEGFVVAVLDKSEMPDPKADKPAYDAARDILERSNAEDLAETFLTALRIRANPQVNQKVFDSFAQP